MELPSNVVTCGRRMLVSWLATWPFYPTRARSELPQDGEGLTVRIQLDSGALLQIPGNERIGLRVDEDQSISAQALVRATPPEKAVPIIYIVYGILSIPVIWDTVQEMLRRQYYGGVIIDGRQTPALITHSKSLPGKMVLFIGADGKSQQYAAKNLPEDIFSKLARPR